MYKSIIIILFLIISLTGFGQVPTTNLQAWYSADSVIIESDYVRQLYDLSGNEHHLIQNNLINRPSQKINAFADNPSVLFDGLNDFLTVDFEETLDQPNTIIVAWKVNTQKAQAIFDGIAIDKRHLFEYPYSATTSLAIYAGGVGIGYTFDKPIGEFLSVNSLCFKSTAEIYDNGSFVGSSSSVGDHGLSGFNLGSRYNNSRFLSGEIAEVIIYNNELSTEDRLFVEKYLMDKYAPPVDLGENITVPYGFCDTTIYLNGEYKNILWSTGDTDDSIIVNSSGSYWVEVTDAFDRVSRDTIEVIYPIANVEDHIVCFGDSVLLKPFETSGYTYLWSNGSAKDSLFFKDHGYYNVQIFDTIGCNLLIDFTITVDSFALKLSLGNDTSLCSGNNIGLLAGEEFVESFLWEPGGETTPIKKVFADGWYKLTALNSNGCEFVDSIYITIVGTAPDPDFEVTNFCFRDTTEFIDLSTPQGNIASWKWIFNESDTIESQNAEYLFANTGMQNLQLVVESFSGCENDTSFSLEIFELPEVSFENLPVCVNTENTYASQISIPESDELASVEWYIDDLLVSTEGDLNYSFDSPGTYTILLVVSTLRGCSNSFEKQIEVFFEFPEIETALISPANNKLTTDTLIVFDWEDSNEARYYQLSVSSDSLFLNEIYISDYLFASTDTVLLSITYDTVYWRVNTFNHCLNITYSKYRMLRLIDIFEKGEIIAWYKPENIVDSGGYLYKWIDNSVNGFDIIQTIENARPEVQYTDNYDFPYLTYDGTNDYFQIDFEQEFEQPMTGFVIWRNDIRMNQTIFDGFLAGEASLYFPYSVLDLLFLNAGSGLSLQFNKYVENSLSLSSFTLNSISHLYHNAEEIGVGIDIGSNGLSGLTFGSRAQLDIRYFNGQIQEFILFDGELSDSIRLEIESYLHDKYFPPVNLLADLNIPYGFPDTTITTASKPWFNSYQWSTGENDTLSTITVSEPGTYAVTVTDIFGFESSDSLKVRYPEFNLWESRSICLGDTLTWDLDAKGPYSYEWSTGATDTAIQVFEAGTYTVTLTDTAGNQWSPEPVVITVDSFPVNATLGPDLTLCAGNRLELEVGQDEAVDFLWQDGSTLPYYRINETEQISVQVTNQLGCVARDTIFVDVAGTAPKADFEFGTTCRDAEVQFNDLSVAYDGAIIESFDWDFGAYGSSSEQNPMFAFADTGYVEVTLYIETNEGCDNDTSIMLDIHELPDADFSTTQVCENATAELNNTSLSVDGELVSSSWFIEDETYNMDNPMHTFSSAGEVEAKLIVVTEFNCVDTIIQSIQVKPAPNADFSYEVACAGEPVYFTNTSIANLNQQYFSEWQFGDFGSSSDQNPFFVFENAQEETVKLIVRQLADGCTDTLSQIIQIHNLPIAAVSEQTGCEGVENELDHNSSWGEGEYEGSIVWLFADTTLTGNTPVLGISEAGTYPFLLKVKNAAGCEDTASSEYTINESPEVSFAQLSDTTFYPTTINLENTSDPAQWDWFINDELFSSEQNPELEIDTAGLLVIRLHALNENGCEGEFIDSTLALTPFIDGGISECRAIISEGKLYVSVDLINIGTKSVSNPELRLTLSNGQMFAETMTGNLYPGEQKTYTFRTQYFIPDDEQLRWLSVELHFAQDQALGNNDCTYIFSDEPVIYPPYPNPAGSFIKLDFTATQDGNAQIKIISLMGKVVLDENRDVSVGLNRIEIPNPAPGGSVHTMEVEVNGKRETFRIIL
jgi:hypothetical protein